jgi:hypothetical protein
MEKKFHFVTMSVALWRSLRHGDPHMATKTPIVATIPLNSSD